MATIIGGNGTGTLDSSLYQLNRSDTTGAGSAGHGEQVYINVSNGNLVIDHLDQFLPSETNGFLTLRTYNSRGQFSTPDGEGWMLSELSRLTSITANQIVLLNGDGSQFTFNYDSSSGVYRSVDGAGAYETLSLNSTAGTYSLVLSNQTVVTYDATGRLLRSQDTNGNTINYSYDSFNNITSISDNSGHTVQFIYQSVTQPDGTTRPGNLLTIQDETGAVFATYGYSGNELTSVTDRAGETTAYAYNSDGTLQSVTLPATSGEPTRTLQFTYSAGPNGPLLASFTDAQGNVTGFNYNFTVDSSGNVQGGTTTVTDALNRVTTYSFDSKGEITDVKDAQGLDTVYGYDANKNLTSVMDANGSAIIKSDSAYFRTLRQQLGIVEASTGQGKLVSELTAADIASLQARFTTRFTYDASGNLTSRTDASGNLTTYTYTSFNKVASTTSGDGNALLTSDDPLYIAKRQELGFINSATGKGKTVAQLTASDKKGILALYTSLYTYDSKQNLTQIKAPGGDLTSLTYDALGNLTQKTVYLNAANLTDPSQQETTQYFYDAFGNNIKTIDAQGNQTTATFDHFGNRLTQVDGNGGVTTYTYDAENQLTSTTDPAGNITLNFYDAVGNRIAVEDAVGHTVTYLYNADNLLISIIDPSADSTQASTRSRTTNYSYDVAGNRTSSTDADGFTTTYTYDSLNRLLTVTSPTVTDAAGNAVAYTTSYAYDGVGNRITTIDNNGNRTDTVYNPDNLVQRVTDASGHITQYAYDADLNQVSIVVGAELAATARQILKFDYDQKDRLISDTDALGNTRHYAYDGANNRISAKDANGNTTHYTYDRDNRLLIVTLPTVTDPVFGQSNTYTIQYQYDANGNQVAVTDQNFNTVTTVFDKDNRAVLVTDGNGINTAYTFDSRGNRTSVQIGVQAHVDSLGHVIIDSAQDAQVETYTYDEFNQIVAVTDGVGNALISSDGALYTQMRKQLGVIDPTTGQGKAVAQLTAADIQALTAQFTEHFTYDRVGNRTSATDHLGHTTSFAYDGLNRLTATIDALNQQTTTAYDGNGNVVAQTDALGRKTTYSYDALNRLVDTTDTLGVTTQRTYDGFGNLTSTTAAFGTADARKTQYVYDLDNRLITSVDPQGNKQSYKYDAVGNRLQVTDAKGQITRYFYDALNRNISVIDPLGFKTRLSYDGVGNRLSLIDANGGLTEFTYDADNREIQINDAMGRSTVFSYDSRGNRISQTTAADSQPETTTYLYDAENHLRQVTDAAGNVTTQGYDATYNHIRTTDANGNATTYAFDALNREIQVTDATGAVTRYAYDAVGNRLSVTDANGHVTTYSYDARNQLIRATDANGIDTTYAYDSVGNRINITHAANTANAATTTFTYDLDGRLVSQTDALGNVQTHVYDGNGNLTSTTDALGNVTTYGYDADNHVTNITDALGNVTQYRYDGNGNRVQVVDALGFVSTSYYDSDNEVVLSIDNDGYATSFLYDQNGNVISRTLYATAVSLPANVAAQPILATSAADQTTTFEYDTLNRLVSRADGEGFVTQYAYDAVGNRISATQALDQAGTQLEVTRSYYDAANREVASLSAQGYLTTYRYDALGNRVAQTQYDQIVSPPSGASVPQPVTGDSGRTTTFAYDNDNRLVQETDALGAVTVYTYDARGNRTSMTEAVGTPNARTTTYTYDAADRYIETTNAVGVTTHLDLDANGNMLARHEAYGTDQERVFTFTYDANSRVVSQTDPLGVVTQTQYDAAGNAVSKTVAVGTANEASTSYSYDGDRRQVTATDANDVRTDYAYDAAGNQTEVTQAANFSSATRTNSFVYNRANRLVSATDAVGTVTQYQYDGAGNKIATVQAVATVDERHTEYAYDLDNRLVQVTDPMGAVTHYQYDAQGNQTKITDADGGVQANTFDAMGHALTSLSAGGVLTRNTYDIVGNLISTTQSFADGSDARTSTYVYDQLNRQTQITDGEGFSTSIVYDAFGNQVSITRGQYLVSSSDPTYSAAKAALAFPQANTFTYDADNRMLSLTDAVGNVTSYQYDAVGNRISTTDGNGNTTQYQYDILNRLVQTTTPEGGVTQYSYDALGNRIQEAQLQSGFGEYGTWMYTDYRYDGDGRLINQNDPTGVDTFYTYDAVGNLIAKTVSGSSTVPYGGGVVGGYPGSSETVRMQYDLDNRKIADIDALGNRTSYTYDAIGNRIKVTDPLGNVAHYYYDGANQLTEVVDPLGIVNTFTYDAAGNRLQTRVYMTPVTGIVDDHVAPAPVSNPLDRTTTQVYDRANRVISETAPDGSLTQYAYDGAGNKLTETQFANTSAPRTLTYAYDANDRLVAFTDVDGSVTTFTYDQANNKTSQTITSATDPNHTRTTTYAYDVNNRVVRETFDPSGLDIVQSFNYDHVGNLTFKSDGDGHETSFSYDRDNREVSQADGNGSTITTITYDSYGNKASVRDGDFNTTTYVYDAANRVVQEYKPYVETYTVSGGFREIQPLTTHVYDANGNEIQTTDANDNVTTRYFDADGRMSAQVSADNVLTTYIYDTAGNKTSQTLYMTRLDPTNVSPSTLPLPPAGDSHLTTYAYDIMGRLTQTTYPPTQITTLVNTDTANPSSVTVTEQVTERNVYDAFGNAIESFDRSGQRTLNYYDAKDRKIATVDPLGYLTEWDYDSQGNVLEQRVYTQPLNTSALTPGALPAAPGGEVYVTDMQYDAASRKVGEIAPQISVFDPNTQTSSLVRPTTTYTYDKAGNQITKTLGAGTSQAVTEYSYYDSNNRLIAVINGNRTLSVYDYDANGNLVSQTRFSTPVPAGVDLTQLNENNTDFNFLVSSNPGKDEETDFSYDSNNRLASQTDILDFGYGNLSKYYLYDGVGNRIRTTDEDRNVTLASYDGMGRLIESISPDGSGTQYQYDAAGNRFLAFTGIVSAGPPSPATSISASIGSQVTVTWNTQGTAQKPQQTWIVYDTVSHQNLSDYASRTASQVSGSGNGQATIGSAASAGTTFYFRVVTMDGAGNETWTDEQSVTVPPRFTAVSVAQPNSSTIVVTAHFDPGAASPKVVYGSSGSLTQSVAFVLQSDGSYQATLSGLSNPGALSFALQWQDSAGNQYSSAQSTFAAAETQVGTSTTISESQITTGGNTAYTLSVNSLIASAAGLTGLQVQWRVAGSGGIFSETAVAGTASGSDEAYSAVLGDTSNLAAGNYEIVLTGLRADGTSVELDHFNYVVGPSATTATRNTLSWNTPPAGNDQLVIIGGQNASSTRDSGRIIATDPSSASSTDYAAFYGKDSSDSHTVNVSSTAHTNNPPTTVITGYDVAVQATLTAAEAANVTGGLHLAWRPAGSGTSFGNDVVLSSSDSMTFTTTLSNLAAGQYDLKLYYVDAQGNQVIVEWQRIDAATVNSAYAGHSLTVLAQESGGTIATDAKGALTMAPGVYTGALDVSALSSTLTEPPKNTGLQGGSLRTDGRSTGYFTETQYDALGYKTASNEGDGLWRQYGVDANGNTVETDLFGDRSSPDYNSANAITTYTAYDARNRKVADFGAPVAAGGSSTLTRPVDRYAYNVLDKVTQHTDALGNTTQYVFNALGTQIEQIDPYGGTTQTRVDQFGNVTAEVTQLGNTTLKFYDLAGRLIKERDAVGNVTTYTYDAFDRKLTQTDALGNTTSYGYDQRDRLTSQTDALGNLETFFYDGLNNRTRTFSLQSQEETDQVYDSLGRVIDTKVYLNGQPTHSTNAYDAYGNLISETDAMGRTKTHLYGAFGRLLEDIDEDGNVIAYKYDVYGRKTNEYDPNAVSDPTAATDPSRGKDIQKTYNAAGEITLIKDLATGVSTVYTYDLLGHRLSEVITTPGDVADRNTTYQYDALGQLVRWSDAFTHDNLNTQYDAEGNVAREYTDNGYDPLSQNSGANPNYRYVDHVYTYDADRRVVQEVQRATDASGNVTDTILNAYTYDAASNRATWNNQGVVVTYTYDVDNRVKEGDYFTGSDSNQEVWTYDGVGNVLTYTTSKNGKQVSSTVNTYNDANRMLTSNKDGQVTTNTYDSSLRITQTVLQNQGKTYYYDYSYYGDGREKSVTAFGDAKGTTVSTYDVNKVQTGLNLGQGDNQQHAETKNFIADNEGHIIYEVHDDGKSSDQIEYDQFLYANGNPVGQNGQNVQGTAGKLSVQLDASSYAPIQNLSDSNPGSNLTYTVRDGDTLMAIANQMYGNASLWFVIADANGLTAGETLKAGTLLIIPNTIKSGTITADNHKVYSETDIVGSTLPNLKSPPPPHHGGCGSILAIIIIVVIAVVAAVVTAGLATAILGGAVAAASAGTAATVAAFAVAGVVVGAIASVVQQGLFIALGYQKGFSWKQVAVGALAGGIGGAAQGVGQAGQLLAQAGKLSDVGATYIKVAEGALEVTKSATQQLLENGKITSWVGLAAAAVEGYNSAAQSIGKGTLQLATDEANSATTAEELESATNTAQAGTNALSGAATIASVTNYVTPWAQVAETYARNGKVTPEDWAGAVGSTLSQAVSDKFGDKSNTLGAQLQNASLRLGTNALVAGALSQYGKGAAQSYLENSVGQEVGHFIGGTVADKLQTLMPTLPNGPTPPRVYDPTQNAFVDRTSGGIVQLPSALETGPAVPLGPTQEQSQEVYAQIDAGAKASMDEVSAQISRNLDTDLALGLDWQSLIDPSTGFAQRGGYPPQSVGPRASGTPGLLLGPPYDPAAALANSNSQIQNPATPGSLQETVQQIGTLLYTSGRDLIRDLFGPEPDPYPTPRENTNNAQAPSQTNTMAPPPAIPNPPGYAPPPPVDTTPPGYTPEGPTHDTSTSFPTLGPTTDRTPGFAPGPTTDNSTRTPIADQVLPQSMLSENGNTTYKGVEIVDAKGAPLGEFDRIEGSTFVEEKSAKGLGTINPNTGQPYQTPDQWAQRQIFDKTSVRIDNLSQAVDTRPTAGGTPDVPGISDIQQYHDLEFRIQNASPDLQSAVQTQLQALKVKYPDWNFTAKFGG